jgi:hypothetical protein
VRRTDNQEIVEALRASPGLQRDSFTFTLGRQNARRLLRCHAELVGSYRLFGTAYQSQLKESRSFGLFDA